MDQLRKSSKDPSQPIGSLSVWCVNQYVFHDKEVNWNKVNESQRVNALLLLFFLENPHFFNAIEMSTRSLPLHVAVAYAEQLFGGKFINRLLV